LQQAGHLDCVAVGNVHGLNRNGRHQATLGARLRSANLVPRTSFPKRPHRPKHEAANGQTSERRPVSPAFDPR
jgi:hypothetical protein